MPDGSWSIPFSIGRQEPGKYVIKAHCFRYEGNKTIVEYEPQSYTQTG